LTYLIKRSTTGQWTTVPFGEWPLHTRPIVLLDEAAREAHMVATCPQLPATNGQAGGDICEKVTSMDDPSFDPRERGTTLISDSASAKLNNVTSTKQGLSAQTGMVVMATNDATNTLWHAELPLTVPLPDPRADFTATPATGAIPLDVQFRDMSGGAPKSWSWNFGDGTTSGARNPLHRYAEPGGYTVTLKITDDLARTSTAARTDVIVAARPKPPPPPAAPPPTPPPALALALTLTTATDPQLRSVAVSAVDTTVPYGAAATLTAQVVGDRLGRVALALQGVRFPFDRPFADLAPVAAVYGAGTHTFRIANVSTKTVVQVVADGTVRSELVTVRSSVRAQITSLRRQGKRVVVRGIVRPATRKGVVVVERRLPTGAFAVTRRTTLLKDGRFAIRVTASAGQRLRAVGYPRDDDAHAPGTSTERRVPAR
jgi:PKD repeat protein